MVGVRADESERSDWRRAAYPPSVRAQSKPGSAIKLANWKNKPAQNNWNLTPIKARGF